MRFSAMNQQNCPVFLNREQTVFIRSPFLRNTDKYVITSFKKGIVHGMNSVCYIHAYYI